MSNLTSYLKKKAEGNSFLDQLSGYAGNANDPQTGFNAPQVPEGQVYDDADLARRNEMIAAKDQDWYKNPYMWAQGGAGGLIGGGLGALVGGRKGALIGGLLGIGAGALAQRLGYTNKGIQTAVDKVSPVKSAPAGPDVGEATETLPERIPELAPKTVQTPSQVK